MPLASDRRNQKANPKSGTSSKGDKGRCSSWFTSSKDLRGLRPSEGNPEQLQLEKMVRSQSKALNVHLTTSAHPVCNS